MSETSSFRRRLAHLRRAAGLSQEALAEKSGLSRNYIGLLETGRREPSLATALKIQRALSVKLEELIADTTPAFKTAEKTGTYLGDPVARECERLIRRFSKYPPRERDAIVKMLKQITRLRHLAATARSRGSLP